MGYKKYLLLIVPMAYVLLGSYFHQLIGLYSLRSADPEFIYFISGLNMANFKFMLGNIDNPGTPLQMLAALVFKAVFALRSRNVSFNSDVLANPDMYLHVLNLVMITIMAVSVYVAGKLLYKISNNITYSILLQVSPFFTSIIFLNIGRVVPEDLMPLPVILLSLLLLYRYYNPENEYTVKHSIWFGLISAFGLSIKLTYFPLWIIPLIVLTGWKNRLVYSATALVGFFTIAFPVTLQFNFFVGWIKGLIVNSGQYGKGESNFVNWDTVGPNFNTLWVENPLFFWIMIILAIVLILTFLTKRNPGTSIKQRIVIALLCGAALQTIILCKQYEVRYFVPALMLIPVSLIMITEFFRQLSPEISKYKIPQLILAVAISVFLFKQVPVINTLSIDLQQKQNERMKAYYYMKTIEPDAIKFTVTTAYGAPIPEYALMHSFGWAGKQKDLFRPVLAELYPDSYIFFPWDNSLNFWGKAPDVNQTTRPTYIYFLEDQLKDQFFIDAAKYFPEKYELTRTFYNDATKEAIYKLTNVNPNPVAISSN